MINKKNIKKIIIDVEGSSYMSFETDLELTDEALGDFYWQGKGNLFEIDMNDLLNGRNGEFAEEGGLEKFLTEEALEYLEHLANYELQNFV